MQIDCRHLCYEIKLKLTFITKFVQFAYYLLGLIPKVNKSLSSYFNLRSLPTSEIPGGSRVSQSRDANFIIPSGAFHPPEKHLRNTHSNIVRRRIVYLEVGYLENKEKSGKLPALLFGRCSIYSFIVINVATKV